KALYPILQNRIEVAHQIHGNRDPLSQVVQLAEKQLQGHSVLKCYLRAMLYDRSVGQRVGIRKTDFEEVDPGPLQFFGNIERTVEFRITGCKIYGKQSLSFLLFLKCLCYSGHDLNMLEREVLSVIVQIFVTPARQAKNHIVVAFELHLFKLSQRMCTLDRWNNPLQPRQEQSSLHCFLVGNAHIRYPLIVE